MKKLIRDLVVGDKFYSGTLQYEVTEILSNYQILVKKTLKEDNKPLFTILYRTEEEVYIYYKTKLKNLSVGERFVFTNNPYASAGERTVLYKDDVAILYVTDHGEYVLSREGDLSGLLNEEVEVVPYDEEA